jgi:hypothetical protein
MEKLVCGQIRGVDVAVRIRADKVETSGTMGAASSKLVLKRGENIAGEFNGNGMDGWWIVDG